MFLTLGVLWGIYLSFVSFWPFPTDYQSCSVWGRIPLLNLMIKTQKARCVMSFSGGKLYQRCSKLGGTNFFMKSDYCQLSFYNPKFIFPTNFDECMKSGGIGSWGKTNDGEKCDSAINANWAKDEKQVRIIKGLVNKCLEITADEKKGIKDGFCELEFIKK